MTVLPDYDSIAISVQSYRIIERLLSEVPVLGRILGDAESPDDARERVREWALERLRGRPRAMRYYLRESGSREDFEALDWSDYATIRILDYCDHGGEVYPDLNIHGELVYTDPIRLLWLAVRYGTGGGTPDFFEDMLHLFRQFEGLDQRPVPSRARVEHWMSRHPSGLDPEVIAIRRENRDRIVRTIVELIDSGKKRSSRFRFDPGMSLSEKIERVNHWWDTDYRFHLTFAVRDPELLNRMLGGSLDPDTMRVLRDARKAGIPTFVNPYYLSLLDTRHRPGMAGADLAIRGYVIYSRQLVEEFGRIVAWEKEDIVEPGKPNAAGWILPSHDAVHRRYPEVAILIPETAGRTCGGLCSSCQRMYGFQRGEFNFDLKKLEPHERWPDKLERLMRYFEQDSQLRDILVTGGDAFMNSDRDLERILDAIYRMALRKREANRERQPGEKYAPMVRVRLGSRLPIYLPQRFTPRVIEILSEYREKLHEAGIKQLIVQTHYETAMEVTPESAEAVRKLTGAGWLVTNQLVFTVGASRRGHAAKLRKVLNDIGVLPYYTFSVKGYAENSAVFATNARAMQEQMEEKVMGRVPEQRYGDLKRLHDDPPNVALAVDRIRREEGLPFLAMDRNVLNLPAVGKSLTFRCIGITRYGRRILSFDHDPTRNHSPIIEKMGRVIIIESKSIGQYLRELEAMGEDPAEYETIWGYSLGQTEPRLPIYEYPVDQEQITSKLTNFGWDVLEEEVKQALAG